MIIVNCDGLCEPRNPGGTATYGWVAYHKDNQKLAEDCAVVCSGPNATNNVAEYGAIIASLTWLLNNGYREEKIELRTDSQLCIYQLNGIYRVKSPRIWNSYKWAKDLMGQFKNLKLCWVPREQNVEADALSRKAYSIFTEGKCRQAKKLIDSIEQPAF